MSLLAAEPHKIQLNEAVTEMGYMPRPRVLSPESTLSLADAPLPAQTPALTLGLDAGESLSIQNPADDGGSLRSHQCCLTSLKIHFFQGSRDG